LNETAPRSERLQTRSSPDGLNNSRPSPAGARPGSTPPLIDGRASLAQIRTDRWSTLPGQGERAPPRPPRGSPGRLSGLVSIDKPADIVLGAEPVVEITPLRMALLLPDVIGGQGDLSLLSVPLRRLRRFFRFQWGLILVRTHRGDSLGSSSCSLIQSKGMAQFVELSFSGPPNTAGPILKKRRAAHLPRQVCGPRGLRSDPPLTSASHFKIYP